MTTPTAANPSSAAAARASSRALKPGTQLRGEFELGGVQHDGEFGISYSATEIFQGRKVVVCEYLPSSLADRAADGSPDVVARPGPGATAFEEGLKGFVHEARLLVGFDLPGLISVLRLWKEHGTAYMALQRVEGVPLRQLIAQRSRAPDETELREWLRRPLETLERLHAAGCVHGNITPDTFLITSTGPVLLGFGGGRHAIGRSLRDMPAVLVAGHAPSEQYAPDPDATFGPWTDLYALASVAYLALTGRPPVPATERRASDLLIPLSQLLAGRYSPSLLETIDTALAVLPGDRPQSVASFRALLDQPGQARQMPHTPARSDAAAAQESQAASSRSIAKLGGIATVCLITVGVLGYLAIRPTDGPPLNAEPPQIGAPQDASVGRNAQPSTDSEPAPTPLPAPLPVEPPVARVPEAAEPPLSPPPAPLSMPAPQGPRSTMPAKDPGATAPSVAQAPAQMPASPASAVTRRAIPISPARTAQRASCTALLDRAAVQPLTHDEVEAVKTECR